MTHSGKSELDAKRKSPVHQYDEQVKFNRSHDTNSASPQRLVSCGPDENTDYTIKRT